MIVCYSGLRFPAAGVIVCRWGHPATPSTHAEPYVAIGLFGVVMVRTMCRCPAVGSRKSKKGGGVEGADIAGNTGASAWSRTRHPPFGEAGAQCFTKKKKITGSRGKASQSPESDWGCARAADLQSAGRPSPTSGMG